METFNGIGPPKFIDIFSRISGFIVSTKRRYGKYKKGTDLFSDFEKINEEIMLIHNIFQRGKFNDVNITDYDDYMDNSTIKNLDSIKNSSEIRANIYKNYFKSSVCSNCGRRGILNA